MTSGFWGHPGWSVISSADDGSRDRRRSNAPQIRGAAKSAFVIIGSRPSVVESLAEALAPEHSGEHPLLARSSAHSAGLKRLMISGLSPSGLDGSGRGVAHEAFEFGEDLFDGVQVRRVGRR
jgi:hypothetical protein